MNLILFMRMKFEHIFSKSAYKFHYDNSKFSVDFKLKFMIYYFKFSRNFYFSSTRFKFVNFNFVIEFNFYEMSFSMYFT